MFLAPLGLVTQKLKTPKWVCGSPLDHFEAASLPCRPAGRKNVKKLMVLGLSGPSYSLKKSLRQPYVSRKCRRQVGLQQGSFCFKEVQFEGLSLEIFSINLGSKSIIFFHFHLCSCSFSVSFPFSLLY